MKLQELRDLFITQYKIQSQIRGSKEIELQDGILASFISQGQQDIQRRLLVVESYDDITLDGSNEYDLPSDFGQHKHAYVGDVLLDEKPSRYIREQNAIGNSGDWFAIYQAGNTQKLFTLNASGTLRIYYYPDFNYYRPSLAAAQDWGNFNGIVFSGKPMLPDRYDMAILYYMLSQVIPDYYQMYEKEIRSLRGSRVASVEDGFKYSLGVDDSYTYGVTAGSTTTTTQSTAASNADKFMRIRATDAGDSSTEDSDGWSTTPTIVNSVSSIVITSTDSEFTNYIHVETNNNDFTWSQTGANTITIYPDPASGWGYVEIIIEVWT